MELKVEEIKELAPVRFNYEDIKKWQEERTNKNNIQFVYRRFKGNCKFRNYI